MGILKNQFSNVVEWEEWRSDMIFWKWNNKEIKKGSRLILRPGQDAVFLYNGKIEGIFTDDGEYDIESQIIPFLSTLKGFKFGFNSGMRAEVIFVNTNKMLTKWGTKSPVMLQAPGLPGGLPIRANGTVDIKVTDVTALIDNVAGIKSSYYLDDVKERIITVLDPLLMKWISQEGKNMFNLQASASEIGEGIRKDLDMQICRDGISVTGFHINSFNYPKEIQDSINKNAAQSMVGDVSRYQQLSMTDAMSSGKMNSGNSTMGAMAEMMMGMKMADQMMGQMNRNSGDNAADSEYARPGEAGNDPAQSRAAGSTSPSGSVPRFCPNCGTPVNGARFCPNCGTKLY